jgi:hypothetical protein
LEIFPNLIINLGECGFGCSKLGRFKRKKVLVLKDTPDGVCYREELSSHFITALAGITLAGNALIPGLISQQKTDRPDATECSFCNRVATYSSESAFVTKGIFEHYLTKVVLLFIEDKRKAHGNEDLPACVIFDGHKAHLCEVIKAWAAQHNILLYLLPVHSSHLCQPLDRGWFRKVKCNFTSAVGPKTLSKISFVLERVHMAFQASYVSRTIWNCWTESGIVPVIEQGKCVRFTVEEDRVLLKPSLDHGDPPVRQAEQGPKVNSTDFGVLNEDEWLIYEAGQCPLCYSPL